MRGSDAFMSSYDELSTKGLDLKRWARGKGRTAEMALEWAKRQPWWPRFVRKDFRSGRFYCFWVRRDESNGE